MDIHAVVRITVDALDMQMGGPDSIPWNQYDRAAKVEFAIRLASAVLKAAKGGK